VIGKLLKRSFLYNPKTYERQAFMACVFILRHPSVSCSLLMFFTNRITLLLVKKTNSRVGKPSWLAYLLPRDKTLGYVMNLE